MHLTIWMFALKHFVYLYMKLSYEYTLSTNRLKTCHDVHLVNCVLLVFKLFNMPEQVRDYRD